VLLPITNFAEEGRDLHESPGTRSTLHAGETRARDWRAQAGSSLGDLLGALGKQDGFYLPSDVFARIADSHPAFSGLSYESLGMRGLPVLESDAHTRTRTGGGLGMGQEATR
jgi:hypothetical protein